MERIRICTVVTGKTLHEFMDHLEGIQKVADFIELRVDHLRHIALDEIELIKHKITCPSIFTCRKKAEGGLYEGSEPERMAILEKACAMAFDYIDLEVASAEKFDFSKKGQTKIIVSFHDFTKNTIPARAGSVENPYEVLSCRYYEIRSVYQSKRR